MTHFRGIHAAAVVVVALLVMLLCAHCAKGATYSLPAGRGTDWTPAHASNFGDGITYRTTIYTNLATEAGADTNGLVDCSALLEQAMHYCPSNQVIYLPAGTYLISTGVNIQWAAGGGWTLRGAGAGLTTLKLDIDTYHYGAISIGNSVSPLAFAAYTVTSGATNTSYEVTLDSVADLAEGKGILFTQTDPDYVFNNTVNGGSALDNNTAVVCLVTNITGTTVQFTPPLPFSFTNSPTAGSLGRAGGPGDSGWAAIGIEDLTFDATESADGNSLQLMNLIGSWVTRCEFKQTPKSHIFAWDLIGCEITGNYFHSTRVGATPSYLEGIALLRASSWNAIYNNVFSNAGICNITLGSQNAQAGPSANVLAYNLHVGTETPPAEYSWFADISLGHGKHPMFNLVEGNVCATIEADNYWGTSSHNTYFRNWATGNPDTTDTDFLFALQLYQGSYWNNAVGNVFGEPNGDTSLLEIYQTSTNGVWTNTGTYTSGVYRVGYANLNWLLNSFDTNVLETLLRVWNYDSVSGAIDTEDDPVPASLWLTSQPDWWGSENWPAINPTNTANLTMSSDIIPAMTRWLDGDPIPEYVAPSPPVTNSGTIHLGTLIVDSVVSYYTAPPPAPCTNIVYEVDQDDGALFGNLDGKTYIATKFDATNNWTVCSMSCFFDKVGSPTMTVTTCLYSHDAGNDEPDALLSETAAWDASGIGVGGWYSVGSLTNSQALVNGTTYWVVLRCSDYDGSNHPVWGYETGANTGNGHMVSTNGSAWTLNYPGTARNTFRLYTQ